MEGHEIDYKIPFTTSLYKSSVEKMDKFKFKHGIKKTNRLLDFLLSNLENILSEEQIKTLKE